MNEKEFLEKYIGTAVKNSTIEQEHYSKYNVKRGLRNSDGSGVLVGLTQIGDVHGYIIDENETVPVEGNLRYRGMDIKDIVEGFQREGRFGFEEVCFLLLFGKLPNVQEYKEFYQLLGEKRLLPKNFKEDVILNTPGNNIMNKLARSVLALYSMDKNPEDNSIENVLRQSINLIALFPTIVVYSYQAKKHYFDGGSLFLHPPKPELSTAENILHLLRKDSKYTRLEAELLDMSLVLHAEHGGGNNSSFSIHVVSSSSTDTYSAITAAIGSLKGARHGGANIKVIQMMADIKKNVKDWTDSEEVSRYLVKILNKKAFDKSGLIYGIGHAVYTLSDPRAVLFKNQAAQLAKEKGLEDEFNLYRLVAELAPILFQKEKNSTKAVSANVDFYSGFVYSMLNIPTELYTPIFAIARIAGWSAHRIEEILAGGRIIRPAYKAVSKKAEYLPMTKR